MMVVGQEAKQTPESMLVRLYQGILSSDWGKGTPIPGWQALWERIVQPKIRDSEVKANLYIES